MSYIIYTSHLFAIPVPEFVSQPLCSGRTKVTGLYRRCLSLSPHQPQLGSSPAASSPLRTGQVLPLSLASPASVREFASRLLAT